MLHTLLLLICFALAGRVAAARSSDSTDSLNPIVVQGTFVDSAHVLLSLGGFAAIASTSDPFNPWADTIGVWYSDTGFPLSRAGNAFKFSLGVMKQAGEPYTVTVSLPALGAGPSSFYYFVGTVFWHNPDTIARFIARQGAQVLMLDTTALPISLKLQDAVYSSADTTLTVLVTNTPFIDDRAESLGIWYGFEPEVDFGRDDVVRWIGVASVKAGNPYLLALSDPLFAGDTQTVYVALALKGIGNSLSTYVLDSARVGSPRPANTLSLHVETVLPQGVVLSWSAPDSVRIWYGRQTVPLSAVVLATKFCFFKPLSADTVDTVWTLNPETEYSFGLQVFRDGLWSAVTDSSRVSITTPALGAGASPPVNRLRLDGLEVEAQTNDIRVAIRYDSTGTSWSSGFQVGIAYGLGAYPTWDTGLQVIELNSPDTVVILRLRESFQFDTSYYVNLWLRRIGTHWAVPTDFSEARVRTAGFSWEAVNYLSGSDTITTALNGTVILRWTRAAGGGEGINDTLRVYEPAATPPGLIAAGPSFSFSQKLPSPPFDIGIRYDSLPAASGGVARIYRDSGGVFRVEHGSFITDSAVWVRTNDLRLPFLVLADTLRPALTVTSDTSSVLSAGSSIVVGAVAGDNIANCAVSLLYGRGGMGFEKRFDDTLSAAHDTLAWTIAAEYISAAQGLRAAIVVHDGTFGDTVLVSRRVAALPGDDFVTPSQAWVPIRTKVALADSSPKTCLAGLAPAGESWTYDTKRFRLFRWYPHAGNAADTLKWIEYSDSLAALFSLVPGRVLWLKTAKPAVVQYAQGVTLSLKETYAIRLSPAGWTDIAMPYKFGVQLKDVLAASDAQADTVQIVRWVKTGSAYGAREIYVPGIPSLESARDTLAHEQFNDAYAVYNPYGFELLLKVPPVAPGMGGWGAATKARRAGGKGWDIAVKSVCGRELNTVHCGVAQGGRAVAYYPLRPRFDPLWVCVADPRTQRLYGHAMACEPPDGGVGFELVFVNERSPEQSVRVQLALPVSFPEGWEAALVSQHGPLVQQDGGFSVSVAANGRQNVWLVAGTQAYLRSFSIRHGASLALLGARPNPFSSRTVLRYSLPHSNFSDIQFGIYDLRGRLVWRHSVRGVPQAGQQAVVWDGRDSRGAPVSSGVYLLRMEAREKGKAKAAVFETTLTRSL